MTMTAPPGFLGLTSSFSGLLLPSFWSLSALSALLAAVSGFVVGFVPNKPLALLKGMLANGANLRCLL